MEKENVRISVVREGVRSLAKEVKEASHGGRVLLFTEEGPQGEDAAAALTFEGLQVTKKVISRWDDDLFAELQKPPEGFMALVGVGGVLPIEATKAARTGNSIPKILFPCEFSALSASDDLVYLGTKGALPVAVSLGHSVLFDPDLLSASPLRPGLGHIAAALVEEADGTYEKLLLDDQSPAAALRALKEKAALLSEIREESVGADVARTALTYLKLSNASPRSLSAHTLALLAARKTGGCFCDYLFPAAYALFLLYTRYLGALPLEHCPPPDRAENLRLLNAKCGIEPSLFYKAQKPYLEGYDDRWMKTAEYREDFLEALGAIAFPALSRLYRRTPHENERSPALSASELLMLLSLTGEAVSGYPLIKHIKMTGLIEPLLKCG